MSFESIPLGEFLTLKRGYDLPNSARKPGDVPIVSSSGITGTHDEAKVEGPGVVTGRYGTLGEVFYVREDFWPLNTSLYVKDFRGNDRRFTAYFLKHVLRGTSSDKAAVPGVNRNDLHARRVTVTRQLSRQSRIAEVLSAYDDLIENNRRRIRLLEESARLLYKEWFVHLRFPGHEHVKVVDGVPEGWERRLLFDIASPTYGLAFRSRLFNTEGVGLPVVRIRDIPSGASSTYTTEDAPQDKLVEDGDFLVGMDGEFHMNFWTGGPAWLNQRVVRLRGKGRVSTAFIRYACEKPIQDLNATIVGTTVAHLGAKHLKLIEVLLPPAALLALAQTSLEANRAQIVTLARQSAAAGRARDLLLPRLMNGEVTV